MTVCQAVSSVPSFPSCSRSDFNAVCCCCSVSQTHPTLCNPTDCSPPGSTVHGILQAKYCSGWPLPPPLMPSQHPRKACPLYQKRSTKREENRLLPFTTIFWINARDGSGLSSCLGSLDAPGILGQPPDPLLTGLLSRPLG